MRVPVTGAFVLALLVIAPLFALLATVFAEQGWSQLLVPGMAERTGTTLLLGAGTTLLAIAWGLPSAWLVEMCEFPGRKLLAFLLFLPFAVPPYMAAFIWADLIEGSGLLPAGWHFRSLGGACLVMSFALYPYIYMLSRASFARRSCGLLAAARVLGAGSWGSFFKVALPLARPAIAAGSLLVFMEVSNDIAVAGDFGLRTLGLHVYDLWLNRGDRSAAAATASILGIIALLLAYAESASRRSQREYVQSTSCYCSDNGYRISGMRALAAQAWCTGVFALGLLVPAGWLLVRLFDSGGSGLPLLPGALFDTVALVVPVVFIAFCVAWLLTWASRSDHTGIAAVISKVAYVGYAFPGSVYALGVILLAGTLTSVFGSVFGLSLVWMWTAAPVLLVYALAARYLLVAAGSLDAGIAALPVQFVAAARVAGKGPMQRAVRVYLPLLLPAMAAGATLMAVDLIKELPLTLILRPFGLSTLAVEVFQHASDEDLGRAAPASLVIILLAAAVLSAAYRWIVPSWRPLSTDKC